MGKLKDVEETYIMEYRRRVGAKYERKPIFIKGDSSATTIEKSARVVEAIHDLNRRFEKKPLKLKGKGKITNKFIILDIEATDTNGQKHTFMWNVGSIGEEADKFDSGSHELKALEFLMKQQDIVEKEAIKPYEDVKIKTIYRMNFKQGFKVRRVIHRAIVKVKPADLKAVTRTMGRRNLHVRRLT